MANINRMTYLMSISEITPHVFLSGQMAATPEQIQKLGINYIVNVAVESAPIVYPKHVKLEKFDIIDFPNAPIGSYFQKLTDKIHTHLTAHSQNKVLVHCMAGISRSTTIVCAYLMRYMNMTLREAYLACKTNRPICFPNLGFWDQLMAYEYQLKKENSVKMIKTQFGHLPDVALEELKQTRQQPYQPASLPFSPPSFVTPISSTASSAYANHDTLFVPSNQTRASVYDSTASNPTGSVRSRSLASNATARSSIVPPSYANPNPSAYQSSSLASSKPSFLTPTRFDVSRLNPGLSVTNTLPASSSSSSMSYMNNRSFPISTSPNLKYRSAYAQQPPSGSAGPGALTNSSAYSGQQRSPYETTYRASFIKPLIP